MGSSGSSNLSVQMSEDGTGDENMISGTEEDEATDYVFRIITTFKPENLREYLHPPSNQKTHERINVNIREDT